MSNLSTAELAAINWASEQIRAGQSIDLTVWHRHPDGTYYSTGGPIGPNTVVDLEKLSNRSAQELLDSLANGAGWRKRRVFLARLVWQYRVALSKQYRGVDHAK